MNDMLVISSHVVVELIKDGKVIQRIEAKNLWNTTGIFNIGEVLKLGGSGTAPLKVLNMNLGSQNSNTAWTVITGTKQGTTNTHPTTPTVVFKAEWGTVGTIADIRQAGLQQKNEAGIGGDQDNPVNWYDMCAIVALGTGFTKADGVALRIEWTTTIGST